MTVPVNDRRIQYNAAALQTVFPYDFKIDDATEISVLQTIKLTGVTNTLTLTTEYTVSDVGVEGGGDITLVTGAAVDDIITITGVTPLSRVTDFNQAGDFLMSDLNDQLDKLTEILQENDTETNRAVLLAPEDTTASLTLPIATDRANNLLGFNASGDAISVASTTETIVTPYMETLLDDATAQEARDTLGVTANTVNLGTLGGVADAYTATPTVAFTVYTTNEEFLMKVNIDNTGASTINIASVGIKALEKFDGAGAAIALEAGDLQADQYYKAVYNGTAVIVLNPQLPYLDGANLVNLPKVSGDILQIEEASDNTYKNTTNPLPVDSTPPQNTEGGSVLTQAFTPISATSTLYFWAEATLANNASLQNVITLCDTAILDALKTSTGQIGAVGGLETIPLLHSEPSGSKSTRTYDLRYGANSGTTYVNGGTSNQVFGATNISRLRIIEIEN